MIQVYSCCCDSAVPSSVMKPASGNRFLRAATSCFSASLSTYETKSLNPLCSIFETSNFLLSALMKEPTQRVSATTCLQRMSSSMAFFAEKYFVKNGIDDQGQCQPLRRRTNEFAGTAINR